MVTEPGSAGKKATLKSIITDLHGGLAVEQAKDRFEKEIGDISATEIAQLEQGLLDDGVSVDEIKQFCNVHALLFQLALEKATHDETAPSHPISLFRRENEEITKRVNAIRETAADTPQQGTPNWKKRLGAQLADLRGVVTHYDRKENVLFPHLEKVGFMGPSKVMWGKDNEIRDLLKAARAGLEGVGEAETAQAYIAGPLETLLAEIESMIFKEENILFPSALEKLDPSLWAEILKESDEVGYAFIEKPAETEELIRHLREASPETASFAEGAVVLPSGQLGLNELMFLLNTLPVDLTYVDSDDRVKYFSESPERSFARPRSVVGRKVQNCHPPQSLHVVEKILTSFKEGTKDSYEFWLQLGGKFIHIRYFAVRDKNRRYLGCLEVSQDLTHLRALEGEKRLVAEDE
jgi:uncharacterized protein